MTTCTEWHMGALLSDIAGEGQQGTTEEAQP